MSYRLISSNDIAIKYPEVNEMPCVFADLPDGLNGQFIDVQPEPSQVARDIATIIENEKDMRVIASAQPEQRWTPVTEGLPKVKGCYLVSVKNEHERRYSKTAWFEKGSWFARQDVIAWMPLPEPYKEVNRNDER